MEAPTTTACTPADDACTLLTLLHRFELPQLHLATRAAVAMDTTTDPTSESDAVAVSPTDAPKAVIADSRMPDHIASWPLSQVNTLEAEFLHKAQSRLTDILKLQNLALVRSEGDRATEAALYLQNVTDGRLLTYQNVWDLIVQTEKRLHAPGVFDYQPAVEALIRACVENVLSLCPFLHHKSEDLRQIEICRSAFSGEDFMVVYEIDFMGGAKRIIWPDANLFGPGHFKWLSREPRGKKRPELIFRDYRYESLTAPLHELMHCIQTELTQEDTSSWASEHDASRLALVLMAPLAQNEGLAQYLPPGKVEEVVLYTIEQMNGLHHRMNEEQHAGYVTWRESWGVQQPTKLDAFTSAESTPEFTDYLKYKIGLEAYIASRGENLQAILATCFQDRTGLITGIPVTFAPTVAIPPDSSFETFLQTFVPLDHALLSVVCNKLPVIKPQ